MKSTTIKLSVQTRDRLRSLGGETYETTILEALDVLEVDRFWSQVDAAVAWRNSLDEVALTELFRREAAADAALDGVE